LPRIGRTSIATHWRSCGLPQSASCSENFVIPPDVFGQTLRQFGGKRTARGRGRISSLKGRRVPPKYPSLRGVGRTRGTTSLDCYRHQPAIFGTMPKPSHRTTFLAAEPDRVSAWRERLGTHGFKIGIAWQSAGASHLDKLRSIPLREFAELCEIPGGRLISLQKGTGVEDIPAAGFQVEMLGDSFDAGGGAFLDSAAVMMNLDLVSPLATRSLTSPTRWGARHSWRSCMFRNGAGCSIATTTPGIPRPDCFGSRAQVVGQVFLPALLMRYARVHLRPIERRPGLIPCLPLRAPRAPSAPRSRTI